MRPSTTRSRCDTCNDVGTSLLPRRPTKAPDPRPAHQRWPRAGRVTTPTTISPWSSSAMCTPQSGRPATKFLVPSIGSRIQRRRPCPVAPSSSPSMASPGRSDPRSAHKVRSTARSASVTTVPSAFSREPAPPEKKPSVTMDALLGEPQRQLKVIVDGRTRLIRHTTIVSRVLSAFVTPTEPSTQAIRPASHIASESIPNDGLRSGSSPASPSRCGAR